MNATTTNIVTCCDCGRDLSLATNVIYVSEGAICSHCLSKRGDKLEGVIVVKILHKIDEIIERLNLLIDLKNSEVK